MPRAIKWPEPLTPRGRGKPSAERLAQEQAYEKEYEKCVKQQEYRDTLKEKQQEERESSGVRPKRGTERKVYEHTFNIPQEELQQVEILAPLSSKQERYLNDSENDIVVWGGAASSGKTQITLLKILLGAMYDPDFVAGITRKSQKQMKAPGSLWSTGCKQFGKYGVRANNIEMTWNFPNGSEVKCHHLDNNQDDFQGTQCTVYCTDESQQCNEEDVWYLTSRLRSKSRQKHQLLLTCNPLNTSFLCHWLVKAGYIMENGLPDPTMDGVTTFMLQIGGEFVWYKTRKEVVAVHGEDIAKSALKFVFYSANVYDNPYIRKFQPTYIHKLENSKPVERDRLLNGNWFAQIEGEGFIKREMLPTVPLSEIPNETPIIRAWDVAATKPHPANTNPDWTRGVKCTYDKETQRFYVLGMESMRDTSALVQALIEQTATKDGRGTYVCIPIDAGAAGKANAEQRKARLESLGYKVVMEPARKAKLVRAETFILACQEGRVFVAPNVFTEDHYRELEAFDGNKCNGLHDDIMDCLASAYTQLTTGRLIPTIRIGNQQTSSHRRRVGGRTLIH